MTWLVQMWGKEPSLFYPSPKMKLNYKLRTLEPDCLTLQPSLPPTGPALNSWDSPLVIPPTFFSVASVLFSMFLEWNKHGSKGWSSQEGPSVRDCFQEVNINVWVQNAVLVPVRHPCQTFWQVHRVKGKRLEGILIHSLNILLQLGLQIPSLERTSPNLSISIMSLFMSSS